MVTTRAYLVPGFGYINDTKGNAYLVPGSGYINETSSPSTAGIGAQVFHKRRGQPGNVMRGAGASGGQEA